jgi:hypothetical protein
VSLQSTTASAEDIAASPAWFPLESAGPGAVRLVRLDEAAYRAASFLDQRILRTSPEQTMVPAAALAAAAARLTPRAHYIFHIGHVGSTLVSRLIGESPSFFAVREPVLLRDVAATPGQERAPGGVDLRGVLALLGRTWHSGQRAVVKATSFVSEIAVPVLDVDDSAAAVFMFTPALAYLRCILGGPNSRVEARMLAASRLTRLRRQLAKAEPAIEPQSEGQWIAMSWLCEMLCLQRAAARFGARILWVDFDAFLVAPGRGLGSICRMFGAEPAPNEIDRILAGPLLRQYAKAPEYAYDAALRREVLAGADREHGAEIRRGMDWLSSLAARHSLIEAVFSLSPKASD